MNKKQKTTILDGFMALEDALLGTPVYLDESVEAQQLLSEDRELTPDEMKFISSTISGMELAASSMGLAGGEEESVSARDLLKKLGY